MTINPEFQIVEVELDRVVEEIRNFYDPEKWHFITINGTDLGNGKLQIDWFFSPYGQKNVVKSFRVVVGYDAKIPSILEIIPSAWLAEWELADMFGVEVEGASRGVFVAPDAPQAPLRQETKL
jgi:Ni,Fe-hydrogenase III component G